MFGVCAFTELCREIDGFSASWGYDVSNSSGHRDIQCFTEAQTAIATVAARCRGDPWCLAFTLVTEEGRMCLKMKSPSPVIATNKPTCFYRKEGEACMVSESAPRSVVTCALISEDH